MLPAMQSPSLTGSSSSLNKTSDFRENRLDIIKNKKHKNKFIGTAGRSRTDMRLPPLDFESSVSTIPPQRHIVNVYYLWYNHRLIPNELGKST